VTDSALVRAGAESAFLRAEVVEGTRVQLFEAEIRATGRNRVHLNKNVVHRARDLLELMQVTVFAPDDLQLVKGGPAGRRDYLDDLLVVLSPRYEAARTDYERVLKQRNALLRGGLRGDDAVATLDVFDLQLATAGAELARGRVKLLDRLVPMVAEAYAELAGLGTPITTSYEAEWAPAELDGDLDAALRDALASHRKAEIDRGVTLVGPHRDEWRLLVGGMESRTHASQGEQRTLALALRLGGHRLCADLTGSAPVLLLDDVFSELDDQRAVALVAHLDAAQTLVTGTSNALPRGITADRLLRVDAGRVEEAA
jgi:DNA replication and repair protein RecF